MRLVKGSGSESTATPLYVTTFAVASKYVIEVNDGIAYIRIPLREIGHGISFREYAPSDVGSIYSHFSKVTDEKSLLKFVHQFGLLGLDIRNNKNSLSSRIIPENIIGFEDKVADIYAAANEIRKVLGLWSNLQKGIAIDRVPTLSGDNPELTVDFLSKTLDKDFVSMIDPQYIDETTPTKIYLAYKISQHLSGVRPAANLSPKGEIIPFLLTYRSTMPYGTNCTWRSLGKPILKNARIAVPGTQVVAGFAHHHPSTGGHPVRMHSIKGKIESGGKSEGMFSLWQVGLNSGEKKPGGLVRQVEMDRMGSEKYSVRLWRLPANVRQKSSWLNS